MTNVQVPVKTIRPDLDFVRKIVAGGGDTVKQCMQCANCGVACELAPADHPFPRKEMILAQWGQKEELFVDPDIWLCFGCTDCSIQCPRGARPGDVLGAVRKETIAHFTPFPAMAKLVESPKWLPVLIAIPVLLFGAILALASPGSRGAVEGQVVLGDAIPPGVLEPVLGVGTMIGMLLFLIGGMKYWKALVARHPAPAGASFFGALKATVVDIVSHARFRKCESGGSRATGHMLTFFGFALLLVAGGGVGALMMFGLMETPIPLLNPLKLALNIGAILIIVGNVMLLAYRSSRPERQTKGSWFDWFFLVTLTTAAATGLLTQIVRLAGFESPSDVVYFIHLVTVWCLLAYAPWSKLAHFAYRGVALLHGRYTGRI